MSHSIYTLLCQRDLEMALITLPRILHFLEAEQKLVIVDDGTLTNESIDKLANLSSSIHIITRKQREEYILNSIKGYPNCIKYRNDFPLAFKLIDIPVIARQENSRFTYTDTDIIYLKGCKEYFNQNTNTYLMTDAIKISVKLQKVFFKYQWEVPYKFNAGYFSFDTINYDLNFIEYYLGLSDVRNMPWLSEQTAWALLFGRSGTSQCPHEGQFICKEKYDGPSSDTLAIHLIAKLKDKVKEWSQQEVTHTSNGTKVIFKKSRNVNLIDWAQKSVRRLYPSL